ncbi:conserved protein, unknown function, partial [Hepatocystis sp. ex Piliocolobus tephrosceles]
PFFKKLGNIRTILLSYYNIDSNLFFSKCMIALFPFIHKDKSYEQIINQNDIEKNTQEIVSEKSIDTSDDNTDLQQNKNINSLNEKYITTINSVQYNDNDYSIKTDNKKCYDHIDFIKNSDMYAFIWLNMFICYILFFLFNITNTFFNNILDPSIINENEKPEDIEINKYVSSNRFDILYNIIFILYSFNIFFPICLFIIVYLFTRKVYPIKLTSMIFLISYNNILL